MQNGFPERPCLVPAQSLASLLGCAGRESQALPACSVAADNTRPDVFAAEWYALASRREVCLGESFQQGRGPQFHRKRRAHWSQMRVAPEGRTVWPSTVWPNSSSFTSNSLWTGILVKYSKKELLSMSVPPDGGADTCL